MDTSPKSTCAVVRPGHSYEGNQGLTTEPCTAVLDRTDPNEQESVVLYDFH